MSFNAKKTIILSIAILLPLIAAALIGSYVYGRDALRTEYQTKLLSFGTYKTDECSSSEATDECIEYYKNLAAENTTAKKIAKYVKYGVVSAYTSYNPVPVYDMDVTQDLNGTTLSLYHLSIYRAVFDGDSDADTVSWRWYYIVIIYDINYTNLRAIITDGKNASFTSAVNTATVPTLAARLYSGDDPKVTDDTTGEEDYSISGYKTRSVSFSTDKVVPDYDAVPTFDVSESKGSLNYIYAGVAPLSAGKTTGYDNWYIASSGTTSSILRVSLTVDIDTDEDETYNLDDITLDNFLVGDASSYADDTSYVASYRQDIVKAGYVPWVIKNYMWWACLLTILVIGCITFAFYAIWLSDAREKQAFQARKRKK